MFANVLVTHTSLLKCDCFLVIPTNEVQQEFTAYPWEGNAFSTEFIEILDKFLERNSCIFCVY